MQDENNLYKAKAVNYFINSVFVFDDKAVVYLNFDDAEPITHFEMLDEMQENTKKEPKQSGSSGSHLGGPRQNALEPIMWINDKMMVVFVIQIDQ